MPPSYLIRGESYGDAFRPRVVLLGVEEILIAPGSPKRNADAERIIGSLRRECLDHLLRKVVAGDGQDYNRSHTHLALVKDAPELRTVHEAEVGKVSAFSEVGELHHGDRAA